MRVPSTTAFVATILLEVMAASGHEYQQTVSAEVAPQLAAILNPARPVAAERSIVVAVQKRTQRQQQNLALNYVNQRRASLGLSPYRFDPVLTRMARKEAANMARRGRMGHVDGVYGQARGAGVGMNSNDRTGQKFNACYVASPRHSVAGAAMVIQPNGRAYYAIYVR